MRKECIKCLPLDDITLSFFTTKTQDVSDQVRKEAYLSLKKQWAAFSLNYMEKIQVQQIVSLIENGLSDPDEEVTDACLQFLKEWLLRSTSINNPNENNGLIPLGDAFSRLNLENSYNHPRLGHILHLFVKEVVMQAYPREALNTFQAGPLLDFEDFFSYDELS